MDRWATALFALLLASCGGDETRAFTLELPDDIEFVAALVFDAEGELTSSTGLTRWKKDERLLLPPLAEEEVASVAVFAWRQSDFAGLVLPREDIFPTIPLRLARGCDPTLPKTARVEKLQGEPPANIQLSASWLDDNCPNLETIAEVDVGCVSQHCPVLVEQTGCRLTFNIETCDFGTHEFRVDWRGQICNEQRPDNCEIVAPRAPAIFGLSCRTTIDCPLDYYLPPTDSFFTEERVDIFPVPPAPMPPVNILAFGYRPMHVISGYVVDFVILEDRIAVSTLDGRYTHTAACQENAPSRTYFFDRGDLSPIGTATAPPCLSSMLAVAEGREYLAIINGRDQPAVARFDKFGKILDQENISVPDREQRYYENVEARIATFDGDAYFIFRGPHRINDINDVTAFLVAVVPETLEQRTIYSGDMSEKPNSMVESSEGRFIFADDESDRVVWVNPATGIREEAVEIPHFQSSSVAQLAFHHETNQLIVLVPIEEPAVNLINSEPQYRGRAVFYEHPLAPLVALTWPLDHSLMIVGGADPRSLTEPRASVALFDPQIGRFLPGAVNIGYGVPSRFQEADGAVYFTLPWEGKLIRLTPAE